MAYSTNILPKSAAYYRLNKASIVNADLVIEAGGYAEIDISTQMLPVLTEKMLITVHPSVFSSAYSSTAVQVSLSITTASGTHVDYLIPASQSASGVFNTEVILPDEEEHVLFTYRISSAVPVVIYNWELCPLANADMTAIIGNVEQALPRLLYDYNTYAYAVAQKQTTVGLITCNLRQATDLQGHFTLSFYATEKCNVHVRIKDNGITELYTPQVYSVDKGYSSISIPHAYIKKSAGVHSFSVTAQCTNGQLSVPVRGLLYTIDGGYLAVRLLDAGVDIQDISIKQLSTDTAPSEIYAIGFESNRLVLKSREYSYNTADWNAIHDFGEGLGAAVEFRGQWLNRNDSDKYTLETEESPVVFIIGVDKTLRAYMDAEFSSPVTIDTNVDQVSACQGFNSMYDKEQDQGLVVTYIKNGNVYYAQYAYISDGYKWIVAQPVYTGGDATFTSVHRLPDYRLGILVSHTSGTKWFITDRTYVSQAVKTELIKPKTEAYGVVTVIEVDRVDDVNVTAAQNGFEEGAMSVDTLIMTYDYPLVFLNKHDIDDLKRDLKVYVNDAEYTSGFTLTVSGEAMSIVLSEPVVGSKTIKVVYNALYLAVSIYNGSVAKPTQEYSWRTPYGTFAKKETINASVSATATISVKGLEPSIFNVSEGVLTAVSASTNIEVSQIITSTNAALETAQAAVTSTVNISVLQVGVSPI